MSLKHVILAPIIAMGLAVYALVCVACWALGYDDDLRI
jgi:hypothetical protein